MLTWEQENQLALLFLNHHSISWEKRKFRNLIWQMPTVADCWNHKPVEFQQDSGIWGLPETCWLNYYMQSNLFLHSSLFFFILPIVQNFSLVYSYFLFSLIPSLSTSSLHLNHPFCVSLNISLLHSRRAKMLSGELINFAGCETEDGFPGWLGGFSTLEPF